MESSDRKIDSVGGGHNIDSAGSGRIRDDWAVAPDSPYFAGHFPGRPILPAVATIEMTLKWLSKKLGRDLQLREVKVAKFMSPISPTTRVIVDAGKISENDWQFSLVEKETDRELATLRLIIT
jgi:3-hydroxyacyl-[acyl-carrier-protein] dehydratase